MTSGRRNLDLDGLRGLAALSVALGHCYEQIIGFTLWASSLRDLHGAPASQLVARMLAVFFPSDAAVIVFFVMSGHVLWESFRRKDLRFFRDLPDYVCARIYRLIPLTIVSAMPFGLLTGVTAYDLVQNMLLLSHSVNGVLWSLQAEMIASALLFVLWGLTKGLGSKMLIGLLVALLVFRYCHGNPNLLFLPAFVMGAGISLIPRRIWQSTGLLTVAITVLISANLFLAHNGADRCLEMGSATMLVGAVSQGQLPFLRWRLPQFLGAISYPFYLTHALGIIGAQPILDQLSFASPYLMIAARAALSIPPAILFAWLLHRLVEVPVQRARPNINWPFLVDRSARRPPTGGLGTVEPADLELPETR